MGRIALALVLCVAAACARNRNEENGPAPEALRLCIRNETVGYGNVVAHAGPTRFTILPGQEQCRPVTDTGPGIQLTAVTTGGGVTGPLAYANTLRPAADRCWRWSLTNQQASALDLEPCD